MKAVEGTWLKGPALHILLMLGGVRPGDFVKLNGFFGHGVPKWGIVLPSASINAYVRDLVVMTSNGQLWTINSLAHGSIRAWMRKPLDLEL